MEDPNARYKLIDSLPLAPGVDWITRSDKGPFVDTGIEVQFSQFGRMYLSVDTIRELAEAAGITGDKTAAEHSAEAAEYFRGYSDAVKENEIGHLDRIVERLAVVSAALHNTGGVALEASPEITPANPSPSSEPDDLYEEDELAVFTTDGPVAQPDNQLVGSGGPARVPVNPSNNSYRL